jgi:hypothetical protein
MDSHSELLNFIQVNFPTAVTRIDKASDVVYFIDIDFNGKYIVIEVNKKQGIGISLVNEKEIGFGHVGYDKAFQNIEEAKSFIVQLLA